MSNAFLGKTSLAKALQGNPCNAAPKETTIGIDFYKWTLFDIEVLIIDCAGERKYMLTHQLFLSTGTSLFSLSFEFSLELFLFYLCSVLKEGTLYRDSLYIDQSLHRHSYICIFIHSKKKLFRSVCFAAYAYLLRE